MFEHDFRQKQRQPGLTDHNRGALSSATRVAWLRPLFAITFGALLTSACHTQQKFPAAALAPGAAPEPQFFEPSASTLDDEHSVTDLSALNAEPAGSHGFVHAVAGHFVDDRQARLRFFGVNLSGSACLPDRDTAARLARHLRKLGFNAVRLHALDGPGGLLSSAGTIAPEALQRLDDFTFELQQAGIYYSFGLHAASRYAGLDGEALARFPQGKLLDRFHAPFLEAQRAFGLALLTHTNSHTLREYRSEPALLYVEVSNEDTLLPSWAGSPDDLPASYRSELGQGYAPWLAERTAAGLRAPGPADEEAQGGLPTFQGSAGARNDYAQYLAATELAHAREQMSFLRQELGLHSMVVDTQVSFGGLAGVLREAAISDFIDAHGYWDQPRNDGSASEPRWSIQNLPQFAARDAGSWGTLASYRVFDKPFVVSEFATPAPSDYAAEMFPILLGIAGLQDWDALFAFSYADQKADYEPRRINGVFDLAGHPAKLAFISTAASAFRRGLVAPAQSRVELNVPEQPTTLPYAESALPTLWSEHGVPPSAAVLRQLGIVVHPGTGEISADYTLHVSGVLGSDTGELLWDSAGAHARFSIDAPALQLVCGRVAQSALAFHGVTFEFGNFAGEFACASLLSLDDQPIASSRRLLLTVVGRAENAHRPKPPDSTHIGPLGDGPALAQYIPFTLTLPSAAWSVQALDTAGRPMRSLPVSNGKQSKLSTALESAALSYAITR